MTTRQQHSTDEPPADRRLLLNIAYRLLGSATEAEDAVHDAYARWYALPQERRRAVRSPSAWLVTTVSRICLDVLRSARVRRERYVGEWLPEPVPASHPWAGAVGGPSDADPAERVELEESLSMALLVLLERLTPAERVAFVLHDVLGLPYSEIAAIVGRTPQACRQLASAGRRRMRGQRRRAVDTREHARVVDAFKRAWQAGDLDGLLRRLDPQAVAVVDGGGLVSAPIEPASSAQAVAQLLLDVWRRQLDLTLETTTVNGARGIVARDGLGRLLAVTSLRSAGGRVDRIWVMRNPDKLAAWA